MSPTMKNYLIKKNDLDPEDVDSISFIFLMTISVLPFNSRLRQKMMMNYYFD